MNALKQNFFDVFITSDFLVRWVYLLSGAVVGIVVINSRLPTRAEIDLLLPQIMVSTLFVMLCINLFGMVLREIWGNEEKNDD